MGKGQSLGKHNMYRKKESSCIFVDKYYILQTVEVSLTLHHFIMFTFFLSPEFSVFVGDLTSDVDDYHLHQFFLKKFPSCKGAKVVTDPYGNSRYEMFQPPALYCITLLGFLWQFDLLILTRDEVVELDEVSFTFYFVFFHTYFQSILFTLPLLKRARQYMDVICRCYKSAKTIVFPI